MVDKKREENFSHLHVHTQYSLLDSTIRLDTLFNKIKHYGMSSVAITDHGSMSGVFDFYQKAVNTGIKPIIGCEFYLAPRTVKHKTLEDRKYNHLVLLAKNNKGYKNLCKLSSFSHLEGFYYKPRIDKTILAQCNEGIICLSGCLLGEIAEYIAHENYDQAKQTALEYLNIFGENNFFLEIQNNGLDIQEKVNQGLIELSKELAIPLVATNDCHYLESNDFKIHKILSCIRLRKTIDDLDKFKFDSSNQLHVKSPKEMLKQFSYCSEAIDNTFYIAKRCNVDLSFKKYYLPTYKISSNESVDIVFEKNVKQGYLIRLLSIKSRKNFIFDQKIYDNRLNYEINIIKTMGFSSYFLIVADFISFAKLHQIATGPGRGSAAGSLVSYSLGITDLDPIEHGLIFERFLNPSRINMPDIDIDFCINGRNEVYKYIKEKYGNNKKVAQIITFGRMNAKMVIRDVGRILAIPIKKINSITKLISNKVGTTISSTLKSATFLEKVEHEKLSELVEISKSLEGLLRHSSIHAAGIVISNNSLIEHMPLCRGKNGEIITQFDLKGIEGLGFVKFDLLGLKNITIVNDTIKMIIKQGNKVPVLYSSNLTDIKTYKLLQQGDTLGVFQLESPGMKKLLVKLKPQSFNEIVALIALYRPGPLDSGVVTSFVERKNNREKIEYIVPSIEPILKETYGIIVYQEQIMKIAVKLAGYSMSDADRLIRAIGKKTKELIIEHREKFINGICNRGVSQYKANKLFDLIEKFGRYGFNKSHSAAYSVITYNTAYLKANYLVEFMTVLLTSNSKNIKNIVKIIKECRIKNIVILPPDINKSNISFTIQNGQIRFSLAAVKNVGSIASSLIIKERENNGEFSSIFNFFQRINLSKVNKRVIESLIYTGAFDSMNITRDRLKSTLKELFSYGQKFQKNKKKYEQSGFLSKNKVVTLPEIYKTNELEVLNKLDLEKKYLGFYLTKNL